MSLGIEDPTDVPGCVGLAGADDDEPQTMVDGVGKVFIPYSIGGNILACSCTGSPGYERGNAAAKG